MLKRNRVVITGLGVLAANGTGKEHFWNALCRGESGIAPVTLCDVSELPCKIAGEVKNFDPDKYLEGKIKAKRLSRTSQLAVAAAKMAVEDGDLASDQITAEGPATVLLGISLGGFDFIEREIKRIADHGAVSMRPTVIGCQYLLAAKSIVEVLGIKARIGTISNTCIGGLDAIARGAELIREGVCERVLAGGADAPIETCLMAGFSAARMLSTFNGKPEEASRPFDRKACGGVLAEGSGIVILERMENALARGCRPYAEITSTATASDADGQAEASGLGASMVAALRNGALQASEIEAINAHGPGEAKIDISEINEIKKVLGRQAYKIPISSIKGNTGNPLAPGGAHQLIAACLSLRHGMIPPTANHTDPIEGCDLNIRHSQPTKGKFDRILINSHGMGGVNRTMIIERCEHVDI